MKKSLWGCVCVIAVACVFVLMGCPPPVSDSSPDINLSNMMKSALGNTFQVSVALRVADAAGHKVLLHEGNCVVDVEGAGADGVWSPVPNVEVTYEAVTTALLGGFVVTYKGRVYDAGRNETTFTYDVVGTGVPPALNHFMVGLPSCIVETDIVGHLPANAFEVGRDPHNAVEGVKWNIGIGTRQSRVYSLTFRGNVGEQLNSVGAKLGNTLVSAPILGPSCDSEPAPINALDVALVVDNSGSQEGNLPLVQQAASQFADILLAEGANRLGMVRVSTASRVLSELTGDRAAIQDTIDGFFITNGWTALYDGIRMANEALTRGAAEENAGARIWRAIVVFTDAQENNSCDEQETSVEGDGICTTIEDVTQLYVNGALTPVYTVGVGETADVAALEAIADDTDGLYTSLADFETLVNQLPETADFMASVVPVKFDLPSPDMTQVRIAVTVTQEDGTTTTRVFLFNLV